MKFLQNVLKGMLRPQRALLLILAAAVVAFLPSAAHAVGGEDVALRFTQEHMIYLYLSIGFGVLSLIFAWIFARGVIAHSAGSENMQAVGAAIREGALAYLKKQVATMSIFVAVIAVGLGLMYGNQFQSVQLGFLIALSFVGGVAASYLAGYAGMLMAVAGNMRTAHAALTSYKRSLEVAFRSGAVAGLVTVGMGLLGATLIIWLASQDAMKLLIGFGFGGSLAALFMRVGGGIFTKAADVGADLVGKVEAGIPEDDPRNPATIADNVGDNVGDCAGMAADVFESYEVTLVAAIVLGAATSIIFDTETWMRLVLFALMARGVGVLASIAGIYFVRGSDNIDMDPLRPIRRGFQISALVAALGTLGLAWFMMGREPIQTTTVQSLEQIDFAQVMQVARVRDRIAQERGVAAWEVTALEIQADPEVKRLGLDSPERMGVLNRGAQWGLSPTVQQEPDPISLAGYQRVDFQDPNQAALNYTVRTIPTQPEEQPEFSSLGEYFSVEQNGRRVPRALGVFHLRVTSKPPPDTDITEDRVDELWVGPVIKDIFNQQVKEAQDQAAGQIQIEVLEEVQAHLFVNRQGHLAVGFEPGVEDPGQVRAMQSLIYYTVPPEVVRERDRQTREGPAEAAAAPIMPPTQQMAVGVTSHRVVEWWRFFAAIAFGILMAFAIEALTDYYVSTHKKPVQEVAGVSNAGPAPMIIQGFALGLESSVFSVFAIVFALIMPLVIFPPGDFGGYILSFYGIALVGLGLLTTTGYILAMDTFGPISDNAQGLFEMSGDGHGNEMGSKAVQRLDAAGNTTKALTKGFAIATAVVAAVALFHSYVEAALLTELGMRLEVPEIFLGLLIGGATPFLFSAFAINAVGRASFKLIHEVRRQFREDPGIMAGTSKPNYGRCVAIVTQAAQQELLGPGILAIALPVAVAFGFSIGKDPVVIGGQPYNLVGAQALGGFLAGAILSGQLMAVLLANSGGIWDNAKKLIEDGLYGGKGSEAHKAGVVCDTVGDPFKDTAGPALNPLIKVMNLVALLLAPAVIQPYGDLTLGIITGVALFALIFSIWWSKRASLSTELQAAAAKAEAVENIPGSVASTLESGASEAPRGKRRITVDDPEDPEPKA
jgi:K(+)-stimulated pyrophosphate-energized sodium pump